MEPYGTNVDFAQLNFNQFLAVPFGATSTCSIRQQNKAMYMTPLRNPRAGAVLCARNYLYRGHPWTYRASHRRPRWLHNQDDWAECWCNADSLYVKGPARYNTRNFDGIVGWFYFPLLIMRLSACKVTTKQEMARSRKKTEHLRLKSQPSMSVIRLADGRYRRCAEQVRLSTMMATRQGRLYLDHVHWSVWNRSCRRRVLKTTSARFCLICLTKRKGMPLNWNQPLHFGGAFLLLLNRHFCLLQRKEF